MTLSDLLFESVVLALLIPVLFVGAMLDPDGFRRAIRGGP